MSDLTPNPSKKNRSRRFQFFSIDYLNLKHPECRFRYKKDLVVISTIAINLLSLAMPIMVLQVYDRVLSNRSIETLKVLVIGIIVIIFIEATLRIARAYVMAWAGSVYDYTLENNAMYYLIHGEMTKVRRYGIGTYLQNVDAFSRVRDFYGGQSLITVADMPFAFLFLGLFIYLAGPIVIGPAILMVLFVLVAFVLGKRLKAVLEHQNQFDDRRYNFLTEVVSGMHTIKSYGMESIMERRYERIQEDESISNYKVALLSSQAYICSVFFNEIMLIIVIATGAPMVMNGDITTGTLVALVILAGRLMQPFQRALFLWTRFQNFWVAKEKIQKIFSMRQLSDHVEAKGLERKGDLEIQDLSFHFEGELLCDAVSLSLKLGDTVLLEEIGEQEKAAFFKLLLGDYIPSEGEVTVDGHKTYQYKSEELMEHIGYLSDEMVIFQGTVMENLTSFRSERDPQAVRVAAQLGLDERIEKLPSGYETMLNDNIVDMVSPDLKQRLMIARMLVNKPRVILLDNLDRALEHENYEYVLRLLKKLAPQVSMIISSNDENIRKFANKTFIFKENKMHPIA
ncbi:ABC transporter transmembrane domain-containing protein [Alphaproteobacteria bacterium]|nr:ABC transporter transmembrane domain-containing protein [Alphaproteobacteria bacterium]